MGDFVAEGMGGPSQVDRAPWLSPPLLRPRCTHGTETACPVVTTVGLPGTSGRARAAHRRFSAHRFHWPSDPSRCHLPLRRVRPSRRRTVQIRGRGRHLGRGIRAPKRVGHTGRPEYSLCPLYGDGRWCGEIRGADVTWTTILPAETGLRYDLDIDSGDPANLYLLRLDDEDDTLYSIVRSPDGGATWSLPTSAPWEPLRPAALRSSFARRHVREDGRPCH